jgi:hypothetical protein
MSTDGFVFGSRVFELPLLRNSQERDKKIKRTNNKASNYFFLGLRQMTSLLSKKNHGAL